MCVCVCVKHYCGSEYVQPVIIRDCHAPPSDVSSDVKTALLMSYEAVFATRYAKIWNNPETQIFE